MQRPIFYRQLSNKIAERFRPAADDAQPAAFSLHQRIARVREQLSQRRTRVSFIVVFFILAMLWLTQHNNDNLIEQALPLPKTSVIETNDARPENLSSKSAATTHEQTAQQKSEVRSTLSNANTQAIQLAVKGDVTKATTQLENALLADPQAGPVFENLRKLYAGFAAQSYQLAVASNKQQPITVELNDAKQTYTVNLPLLATNTNERRTLANADNNNAEKITTTENKTEPSTTNVNVATNTPAPTPTKVANVAPAVVAPPAPVKAPPPPPLTAAERREINTAVMAAVKRWSEAWSQKDSKAYIQAYAPNYAPKTMTHKAWVAYRTERLAAPIFITVELADQKAILLDPTHVRVSFLQKYTSDLLSAKNQKTLELELINHKWLITSESER